MLSEISSCVGPCSYYESWNPCFVVINKLNAPISSDGRNFRIQFYCFGKMCTICTSRNYNAVSSRKRAIQEFRSLKLAQTHRVNVLYCIHAANTESHPVDLQVILNPDQSSSRLHFATVLIFWAAGNPVECRDLCTLNFRYDNRANPLGLFWRQAWQGVSFGPFIYAMILLHNYDTSI